MIGFDKAGIGQMQGFLILYPTRSCNELFLLSVNIPFRSGGGGGVN